MARGARRAAAVAGSFYSADARALGRQVSGFLAAGGGKGVAARAIVAPHAGYIYSGSVAGQAYGRVEVPARVVVLAVNHRGRGESFATWSEGFWETPLGELEIDADLVARIVRRATFLRHDPTAHAQEHSLEVQLPFLQCARTPPPRLVPISISSLDSRQLSALGLALAEAVRETGEQVLLVASTDLTHYEDAASARAKDELALARIEAVDGPGLLATVMENDVSMCGVAPTMAALVAARALGAERGEVVAYASSGDVTGDLASVVGYAAAVIA